MRLEPAALRSRVKHSTTEPLRSPKRQSDFAISRGFHFSQNFEYAAKFRENKPLAKISEFTVLVRSTMLILNSNERVL